MHYKSDFFHDSVSMNHGPIVEAMPSTGSIASILDCKILQNKLTSYLHQNNTSLFLVFPMEPQTDVILHLLKLLLNFLLNSHSTLHITQIRPQGIKQMIVL